ncbi:2-oxoacid:acceptor oxidoreductase subunit alpha [bacterium]|nr:2-oxoacid:acceptor oxidoreductase subunit alpha [bacterium]
MSDVSPLPISKEIEEKDVVVIRFCGDSGDGMQITGSRFTQATASVGNDLATLPDFPAEIRAPAGSLAGVSGYQIQFSSREIRTPGDAPDVLVAMNPAAFKTNLADLKKGGILIVNSDAFNEENLKLAGYAQNPLDTEIVKDYDLYKFPITTFTTHALETSPLIKKDKERCKNFFALGLMYWLYQRPFEPTLEWIDKQFSKKVDVANANKMALKAGYYFGETTEAFKKSFRVAKAQLNPGTYRNITGNEATAIGFITAAQLASKNLTYATYPITPASDILHELSKHKNFGIKTIQAEDEIAAIGVAIGASFAGDIGLTGTSGPGVALKSEALSLALMMELPLVLIDVQRGGPSTGLPTKTEQADLLQALYGRHGEAPVAVVAPATAGDCFHMAIEAVRIATEFMTPVIYLSDGYLANSAEPWVIPDYDKIPKIKIEHPSNPEGFKAYQRNEKLARPWAIPGVKGLEHRLGGLEKQDVTGNISYDPKNHEHMSHVRANKIKGIAKYLPPLEVFGKNEGDVLVIGWGGTHGSITSAVDELQKEGMSISSVHLRYLNPIQNDLYGLIENFETIIVPEINLGQLVKVLRAETLRDIKAINKIQGKPFKVEELKEAIKKFAAENAAKNKKLA